MISAIIFVFWPEEEDYLEACLKTLIWVDEIIVIDNGATEKALKIAQKYTHNIFKSLDSSFAKRHNLGREHATGDWLLYVDSDERISRELRDEILAILENPTADAYELPRINYILGKEARFGFEYPEYFARLFKKDKLVGWSGQIHESSTVSGKVGRLAKPMYHLTHRSIFTMIAKTINFADHEAQLLFKADHPPVVWWRLPRVFFSTLFSRLILKQGWRLGIEGWIDYFFQAFSTFIVYVRLWELQRKPSLEDTYKDLDKKIIDEFK